MANPNSLKNLKPAWKKGESGNPKGAKPLPPDVKIAKKLTDEEFARSCAKLMFTSVEKLEKIARSKESRVIDSLVARILQKGINESSRVELNFFVERFLGKVPENHNFSGSVNGSLADFIASRKDDEDEK